MARKSPKNPEHMFVIQFECLANLEVTEASKRFFDNYIDDSIWVLHQNGFLISERSSVKMLRYFIDLSDEKTIRCFNRLPAVMKKKAPPEEVVAWGLNIYETHIPEHSDTLCVDIDGYLFIREYRTAWAKHQNDKGALTRAVAQESRNLR